MGITEPSVNFKNNKVLALFTEVSHQYDKHQWIQTSYSNQLLGVLKNRGGTMTTLSGRWIPRKIGSGSDSKGRWSHITILGKNRRKITIVTAYRVCQQNNSRTCTISEQQRNDFIQEGEMGLV